MSEFYQAMTLLAPRTLEAQRRPLPRPDKNEAVIKVQMAGICGTDLSLYRGLYKTSLPLVLGHEFCGTVEAIGENVAKNWLGRRVAVEINNSCISREDPSLCPECAHHLPSHCRKRTVLGIAHADGAFAEWICVPAHNLHPLPDQISDRAAVLIEPMAAALQTFIIRPLQHNENVVVLGAGRLGLLIVAAARSAGAHVVAVSRSEQKRAFAKRFGAQDALAPSADLSRQLQEIFGQQLADVVVDATGDQHGLQDASQLVRPRGTICLKTTLGQPSTFDLTPLVVNEIQLSASRCGPFASAIHFLEHRPLPLDAWTQETFPLHQLGLAMQAAAAQPGKVFVDPTLNGKS